MKDDVYVGYEINSKKNEINLCNGVDCVHIVYTPWATSKQHRVFSPMFHAVSFCLVWNHTRIRTRSNSHLPECIKNSGSSIPFCTSTSAYYSITLHSFSNISPLFPFCTRSFFLSFFLSFITQFDGVDANERAFQHKHTRTRSHSHSTNSFYIFRASHMIFPLVVGCFLAMLVRHSCIYSPYFICAAILCLYATDTIKVFDYT